MSETNVHEHTWRVIKPHVNPLNFKQEVCSCGMRRFTWPDGSVHYFAGYYQLTGASQ